MRVTDDEPVQNTGREQTFAIEQTVQDATEQTVATEQTDVIDLTKSSPAQTVVTEQTVESAIVAGTLVTSDPFVTPSPGIQTTYTGADPFSPPLPAHTIKRKLTLLEESVREKEEEIALLRMMLQSREDFDKRSETTPPVKRLRTADSASATPDLKCSDETVPDSPEPLVLD